MRGRGGYDTAVTSRAAPGSGGPVMKKGWNRVGGRRTEENNNIDRRTNFAKLPPSAMFHRGLQWHRPGKSVNGRAQRLHLRLVFFEANSVAIIERCYRDGELVIDQTAVCPPREITPVISTASLWIHHGTMEKNGDDLARVMKTKG